ncbi:MAG: DUF4446 family protein [Oscillospiraceae bacterium]|nr:DUF4446 family protein [Oscillospiraceae bacterium]
MDALLAYGEAPLLVMGIMFSLLIGTLVLTVSTRADLNHVRNDYGALLDYLGDDESRDLLHDLASLIRGIERDNRETEKDIAQLYSTLGYCIQKVAVVRYNAFHNVGSDQSFSLALLDHEDNGVVISGIFGRDSSTTYAKPVKFGVSDYVLTEEEGNAIGLARKRYIDMTYYRRGSQ